MGKMGYLQIKNDPKLWEKWDHYTLLSSFQKTTSSKNQKKKIVEFFFLFFKSFDSLSFLLLQDNALSPI
ncbi:MAG: hypothetical protein RMI79_07825, partial [Nitrososphaerota archaeon]|nr:hypothetical protein [Nitrososphaerota archaeon]